MYIMMDRSEFIELLPSSKDCDALVPTLLSFSKNLNVMFEVIKEEFKSAISYKKICLN